MGDLRVRNRSALRFQQVQITPHDGQRSPEFVRHHVYELGLHLRHTLQLLVGLNQLLVGPLKLTLEADVRRDVHRDHESGLDVPAVRGDRHDLHVEIEYLVGVRDEMDLVLLSRLAVEGLHQERVQAGLEYSRDLEDVRAQEVFLRLDPENDKHLPVH